ncbi:MAG: hypothetical protein ABF743_10210 [Schleiferilactobacillus perolens]|uniref:hypothetical protein n=1 Tax=Schleiferilactobacillus perolens TaxID=100468 RepID=UPI0039E74E07
MIALPRSLTNVTLKNDSEGYFTVDHATLSSQQRTDLKQLNYDLWWERKGSIQEQVKELIRHDKQYATDKYAKEVLSWEPPK